MVDVFTRVVENVVLNDYVEHTKFVAPLLFLARYAFITGVPLKNDSSKQLFQF